MDSPTKYYYLRSAVTPVQPRKPNRPVRKLSSASESSGGDRRSAGFAVSSTLMSSPVEEVRCLARSRSLDNPHLQFDDEIDASDREEAEEEATIHQILDDHQEQDATVSHHPENERKIHDEEVLHGVEGWLKEREIAEKNFKEAEMKIEQIREQMEHELNQKDQKIEELQHKIENLKKAKEELRAEYKELQKETQQLKKNNEKWKAKYDGANKNLEALTSTHKFLVDSLSEPSE